MSWAMSREIAHATRYDIGKSEQPDDPARTGYAPDKNLAPGPCEASHPRIHERSGSGCASISYK